ncbi:MAG: hypothetical protein AAB508_00385 [Patescibacteria group bacterium]
MNFKFGMVVAYIPKSGADIRKAAGEFFGKYTINPDSEIISSLFNEWLIFDYKIPGGTTVITEYFLKNPDALPENLMDELRQIIQTSVYDLFEVERNVPGVSVTVIGIFTGKRYTVSERSLSLQMENRKGTFYNRVARVGDVYYFVGSNPAFYPMTYTERMKTMLRKENKERITPKHAAQLVLAPAKQSQKKNITKTAIRRKRLSVIRQFAQLKHTYGFTTSFETLADFLYQEDYRGHYADFYTDLKKIGIGYNVVVENTRFFEDFWNYFPHKVLDDRCPTEKYQEYYG